jgi:N-acetylmuramic acid 6-phosphate etherase
MRITERENPASASLDTKTTREILRIINREDHKVPAAVAKVIPQIAHAVDVIAAALMHGGRLVYLGAGTSGRLGVLDASECVPTFGTNQIIGVIAGGPRALYRSTEAKEDDARQGAQDLQKIRFSARDVLVAISASGRTPYALGAMRYARKLGAPVITLACNPDAPMVRLADIALVPVVGPEVIAGSTRLKAGTAQKLVLNMLSTASMVRAGRVFSNWMINVQITNRKLRERACGILMKAALVPREVASRALRRSGGQLPAGLLMLWKKVSPREANALLRRGPSIAKVLRAAQQEFERASGRPRRPARVR